MCVDVLHQIKDCTAVKREEAVMQQWDATMGSNVEVFFPTKRRNRAGKSVGSGELGSQKVFWPAESFCQNNAILQK